LKAKSRRVRVTAVGAAIATAMATLLGLVGVALTAAPASAGTNANTSYEFDCTTTLQPGVAAPFLITANLNGAPDPAFPTGASFGVSGALTGSIPAPVVAGLEQALNPATIGLNLGGVTLGSTDGTATGSSPYSKNFAAVASAPARQVTGVSWASGGTTLTAAAGTFTASDVGLSVAGPSGGGISPASVITAQTGGTATISVATTAAGTAATIGLGDTKSFTDPAVSTGNVFTTNGVNGGHANIGVTQATTFGVVTPAITVGFGGAAGVGTSNCLETGFAGPAPGTPGPAQTGEAAPALPFGTPGTTPLVLASGGFLSQPGTAQMITPPPAAFVALADAPPTANNGSANLGVGGTKTITLSTTDTDATPTTACSLVGSPSLPRLAVSISNSPTPCQATLTDSGTGPATVTFQFNATDGVGTGNTATETVSIGTPPVDEPLTQVVNGGQLVLSCSAPGSPTLLTCPEFQFPAITLNGQPQTTTGNGSTLFVSDNRGDPTVGWTLQASMVATPIGAGSNTNPSCSGVIAFCNANVGTHALQPNGQISKSNLSIGNIACPAHTGNPNPAATAGAGGSFASTQQICSATAGQSGGSFDVTKTYSLTIPPSVFAGTYWGTVEFLVQ
jgi:hypothetical protein